MRCLSAYLPICLSAYLYLVSVTANAQQTLKDQEPLEHWPSLSSESMIIDRKFQTAPEGSSFLLDLGKKPAGLDVPFVFSVTFDNLAYLSKIDISCGCLKPEIYRCADSSQTLIVKATLSLPSTPAVINQQMKFVLHIPDENSTSSGIVEHVVSLRVESEPPFIITRREFEVGRLEEEDVTVELSAGKHELRSINQITMRSPWIHHVSAFDLVSGKVTVKFITRIDPNDTKTSENGTVKIDYLENGEILTFTIPIVIIRKPALAVIARNLVFKKKSNSDLWTAKLWLKHKKIVSESELSATISDGDKDLLCEFSRFKSTASGMVFVDLVVELLPGESDISQPVLKVSIGEESCIVPVVFEF